MKWVTLAALVAVAGGATASVVSKRIWPLLATAGVALGMYGLYAHAKRSGLESNKPSTEQYGGSW